MRLNVQILVRNFSFVLYANFSIWVGTSCVISFVYIHSASVFYPGQGFVGIAWSFFALTFYHKIQIKQLPITCGVAIVPVTP